jgi:hypothetical protein
VVRGYEEKAEGYTREEYQFFNEYTGRLAQVLRGARRDAGVALYYPIAMFQADLLASSQFWPKINELHQARQDAWDRTERTLLNGDVEYMIVHPEAVKEAEIDDGYLKIGYGSYHTLVMPQMDYLPLAVTMQLKQFEHSGGKILWVDKVPGGAEHFKNNGVVKTILKNAQATPVNELAQSIENACSAEFDLTFTPGTDELTIGRFLKGSEQVYLLVNREQEPITVSVQGHRQSGGKIKLLNPSNGEISMVSLPVQLSLEANRAVMLIPDKDYMEQELLND